MTVATTERSILDAARRLVVMRGPGRLTLSAVAAEAGISRPTLYRWFPSKAILLAALAADSVDRFDRGLRDVVTEGTDPDARLRAALGYIVGYLDHTVGPAAVHADIEFTLQTLADTIESHATLLADLLDDSLDRIPAVAGGAVTRSQAADLVLRVAYSHYLVPHPDPDELVGVLRALVGLTPAGIRRRSR